MRKKTEDNICKSRILFLKQLQYTKEENTD